MIANAAFLAAMILLIVLLVLLGELEFLAQYRGVIVTEYRWYILGAILLVFLNMFGWCYLGTRRLFLKETGQKLAHVEKLLHTGDTVVRDLSDRLAGEE